MQIKRDNHFVPQFHLKHWAVDKDQLWQYRLLVSHANVPTWNKRSIRSVAYRKNLYTEIEEGHESDEHEIWLEQNYESPAAQPYEKVLQGKQLRPTEMQRLVLFMVAQDLRTPRYYLEHIARGKQQVPELMQKTIEEVVNELEETKRSGTTIECHVENETNRFAKHFSVTIEESPEQESDFVTLKAEMSLGRSSWISSQRHLLENRAEDALRHSWCIVEAQEGLEWFTTDDPVVHLNYYPNGSWDLKGGWDNPGTTIYMPLSPRFLLFTEVGRRLPEKHRFANEWNHLIRNAQAHGAVRSIFAHRKMEEIERMHPRVIDAELFNEEDAAWKEWHRTQGRAESGANPSDSTEID